MRTGRHWARLTVVAVSVVSLLGVLWLFAGDSSEAADLDFGCENLDEKPGASTTTTSRPGTPPTVTPSVDGATLYVRGLAEPGFDAYLIPELRRVTAPDGTEPAGIDWVRTRSDGRVEFKVQAWPAAGGQYTANFSSMVAGPEITIALTAHLDTASAPGVTNLFRENFALAADAGTHVSGTVVKLTTWFSDPFWAFLNERRAAGAAHRLRIGPGVQVSFTPTAGTANRTLVEFAFHNLNGNAELPARAELALTQKSGLERGETELTSYWALGQAFDFNRPGRPAPATEAFPGTGVAMTVDDIVADGTRKRAVEVDESWSLTPPTIALGSRQTCAPWGKATGGPYRSTGHMAWNATGLVKATQIVLDVNIRTGVGEGLHTRGADGVDRRSDAMALDGQVVGLPDRMDFVMHPESLALTRSDDLAPSSVTLRKLQLASDPRLATTPGAGPDPTLRPVHAEGVLRTMPRHFLMSAAFDGAGDIAAADLGVWTLGCVPGTPWAPDSRPDLVDSLPPDLAIAGCVRNARTAIGDARVVAQDWIPGDRTVEPSVGDWPALPTFESGTPFVSYASRVARPGVPADLWRFGGRLHGVSRGFFDTTGAPSGGSRVHVRAERSSTAVDDARVLVNVDTRTSTDEVTNTGTNIVATGLVPAVPATLDLDYTSAMGRPVRVDWAASAPIRIADGTVKAQLPGPAAMMLESRFRTLSTTGLPASGRFEMTDAAVYRINYGCPFYPVDPACPMFVPTGDSRSTISYVPAGGSAPTELAAGATLSTRDERARSRRLRMYAEVLTPRQAVVEWVTRDSDASLRSMNGAFCSAPDAADCGANSFDATAVYGRPAFFGEGDLLIRPTLPTVPFLSAVVQPAFTNWRSAGEQGVRAIVLGPDEWGVDGEIRDLARASYTADPQAVEVVRRVIPATCIPANPPWQPFPICLTPITGPLTVNVHVVGISGPSDLWANARLSFIPQQVAVRLRPGSSTEPWLWVNTENVDLRTIGSVDWSRIDTPTSPALTAVVRYGDPDTVGRIDRTTTAWGARRTSLGVDVQTFVNTRGTANGLGIDATVVAGLPRHLAVWEPTQVACRTAFCQSKPHYEIDESQRQNIRYRSTLNDLGPLRVSAELLGNGSDLAILGDLQRIPGSLSGDLTITRNRRLPWTDVDVNLDASTAIGTANVDVFDRLNPASYRVSATDTRPTSNYGARLSNVGPALRLSADVRGPEPRAALPPTTPERCRTGETGVGFVHADLNLNSARDVNVLVKAGYADAMVADVRADRGISGFVNGRVDHFTFADTRTEHVDAMRMAAFDIVGAGFITAFPLEMLILTALLTGDVIFDACLEVDLPVTLELDRVDRFRAGLNLVTLSVDEHHVGGGVPSTIGFSQRSMRGEPALTVNGAFYRTRDITFRSTAGIGFGYFENQTNVMDSVSLLSWTMCADQKSAGLTGYSQCFRDAAPQRINSARIDTFPTRRPAPTWVTNTTSNHADILIDPVFSAATRTSINEVWPVRPGQQFYGLLTDIAPPLEEAAYAAPATSSTTTRNGTATMRLDVTEIPPDPETGVWGYRGRCTLPAHDWSTAARAVDGTLYRVIFACTDSSSYGYSAGWYGGALLEARHGSEVARWTIALPRGVGFGRTTSQCMQRIGSCSIRATVSPRADGSISVAHDTFTTGGVPLGQVASVVDASGHPGDTITEEAVGSRTFALTVRSGTVPNQATLDPASWLGAGFVWPAGFSHRWIFGDGTMSPVTAGRPATVTHDYPTPPVLGEHQYRAMLLKIDASGRVVDRFDYDVRLQAPFIFIPFPGP